MGVEALRRKANALDESKYDGTKKELLRRLKLAEGSMQAIERSLKVYRQHMRACLVGTDARNAVGWLKEALVWMKGADFKASATKELAREAFGVPIAFPRVLIIGLLDAEGAFATGDQYVGTFFLQGNGRLALSC